MDSQAAALGAKTSLETPRLLLRHLVADDAEALAEVLSDREAMRWYPHPFSREEVDGWIDRQRQRYQRDGFGLWAIEWKESGRVVGDCGLMKQPLESETVVEVGYHIVPSMQRRGVATEAAGACRDWAREVLKAEKLYAFVRPENEPSRKVAAAIGMAVEKTLVRGAGDFLHEIWAMQLR